MSSDIGIGVVLLGIAGYFAYQAAQTPATKQTGTDVTSIFDTLFSPSNVGETPLITAANGFLTLQQVHDLAQSLIDQYGFNVSADMATAIAIIESGDISLPQNGCNPNAYRYESGINDASLGIMQVLSGTAAALAGQGYSAFGIPAAADLYNPQEGMYFGLANLDQLSRNGNADGTVSWIVQSYNAGPGHASTAYLTKFNTALAWLQQNGI